MPYPSFDELMNPEQMLKSFLLDTFEVFVTKWQGNQPLPTQLKSFPFIASPTVRTPKTSLGTIRAAVPAQTGEYVVEQTEMPPTAPTASTAPPAPRAPTRSEIWNIKAAARRRKMEKQVGR